MKIFVQIASYRDPELPKTLRSLLDNAKHPENLVICIAHQFDETEDISEFEAMDNIKVLKIPHAASRGACWARNLIQQQYNDEDFTLQLDSHHRFVPNWDVQLIEMLSDLQNAGHPKPLLTSYIASFDPDNDPEKRVNEVWKMDFDRFTPEGVIFFLPSNVPNHNQLTLPIPSRFFSAHFTFTLGRHCREVPHDPSYYFHGEEISLAVRSFTHGYDLFHPHKLLAWHEYTRKGRSKHWDDSRVWGQLNDACLARNRQLFGMDGHPPADFGLYGFGRERTLRDYEEYAGICFKTRSVQKYTLDHHLAPNPKVEDFEASLTKQFKHCIDIQYSDVPEDDYTFWCVAFHDKDGNEIYRQDALPDEIQQMKSDPDKYCKVWRTFEVDELPAKWCVWPYSASKQWCPAIEGTL